MQVSNRPGTITKPLPGLVSVLRNVCVRVGEVVEGNTRIETYEYADAYLPITGTRTVTFAGEQPSEASAEMILPDGRRLTFHEDFRGHPNPSAGSYQFELSFTERMKAEWFNLKEPTNISPDA